MNFNEYQNESRKTWLFGHKHDFIRSVLGLFGEAGEIAEKLKKEYRDNKVVSSDDLKKELGDVLYYVARIADYYKLDLEEVASHNIEKLFSRKARGKIQGDGDDR